MASWLQRTEVRVLGRNFCSAVSWGGRRPRNTGSFASAKPSSHQGNPSEIAGSQQERALSKPVSPSSRNKSGRHFPERLAVHWPINTRGPLFSHLTKTTSRNICLNLELIKCLMSFIIAIVLISMLWLFAISSLWTCPPSLRSLKAVCL